MSNSLHPESDTLTLESPIDALQASPEFQGPVEPLTGDSCNDHFALLYESRAEQFAATAPFVRQGLERGEKCLYVIEDGAQSATANALRGAGVDVDAAMDAGALVFETIEDTYLAGGEFDAEEMTRTYADLIEETTAEYEALRVVAEMSWILRADVSVEESMAYESRVNDVFEDEDAIALCQYDRTAFPPEVLCDVVRVHPHLITDNTVCHNFYYTPPEEFFGPEKPANELDRMLGTLLDRTEAKAELEARERYLKRQTDITADPEMSFEEKLQALFDLGCDRFDLDLGGMARVDVEADRFAVERVSDEHDHFEPGVELPLSETYCAVAVETGAAGCVTDPEREGHDDITVYDEFGVRTYLGTYVEVEGGADRTLFFVGSEEREDPFSDDERACVRSMGQWVKYELEQHQRERELERAVERLETSNERLERFAYAASHDLQEPLRMVSSYLRLVERRADAELSAETREYLEFAVDGADRMHEMVEGLLAYSRIETGGDPFEPTDLDAVFADVREDLALQLEESDADLAVASLPRVEGDRSQLRQLFQNLLHNAITYSGDEPPAIEVDAERDGEEWVIAVSDDGIGIDPDEQDRIFDVFDRLHSREEYDGTGIGLAVCERIVERHGGDIWVDSKPGEGSTFRVALPAASV